MRKGDTEKRTIRIYNRNQLRILYPFRYDDCIWGRLGHEWCAKVRDTIFLLLLSIFDLNLIYVYVSLRQCEQNGTCTSARISSAAKGLIAMGISTFFKPTLSDRKQH